jgi:hypothetical protein
MRSFEKRGWGSQAGKFDLLKTESCFTDLVNNKFDLAQFEGQNKEKTLYKAISETMIRDDNHSVVYKYNDDFFRSDNFIKDHDGLHILFSGCSESEGVGSNIEDAWTHILYKKISEENKCSGFFNLSRSGWGWSKIVVNALIYFEKYGYPDIYFILLPNHQRMHRFFIDGAKNDDGSILGNWKYLQSYPKGYYGHKSPSFTSKTDNIEEAEYKEQFIQFFTAWKLFDKICKDNKIKLIFATWDEQDSQNIRNIGMFNNFLDMDTENLCEPYIKSYYQVHDKTVYDLKKRDGHSGILVHNFWAERFYNFYKDIISNV